MRVLVDTNVILDMLLMRPVTGTNSRMFFEMARDFHDELCVSTMTFRDIEYVVRRQLNDLDMRMAVLRSVYSWVFKFVELTADDVINAMFADRPDYEDSLLIEGAERCMLDAIITNNKKDFVKCHIPIFAPEEYLMVRK